ncbi:vWA domain-containing protein [Mangrovibacillus cuniculi]|uniref:VWA domain-containing protein n=1 Tax=Mangrovibacillus cuniculi TaxID=2593652 RepID=A0A7S8HG44_9BACI|nr:VWA domain-containing protein [Mangrovibacillus cuniculi]QPC47599.1 VWA domain-containing protein [Mangrovibacillus cuniculi]
MKKYVFLIMFLLVVTGCSNKGEEAEMQESPSEQPEIKTENNNKTDKEENQQMSLKVDPLPSTYEELANQPTGKLNDYETLSGQKERTVQDFSALPDLPEKPTTEQMDQFYRELLRLVQKEFKGPEEAIKQLTFQSFGSPEIEDQRYQFKDNLNVVILLDASGSMANQIDGKAMMDSAKDSIETFVETLPEDANIGLRVYGQNGDGSEAKKELSCSSSELVYSISNYEQSSFQQALDTVKPAGWTPIELALKEAQKDLSQYDPETNTNIIYLVSDGIETCDGDPVKAAKELYNSSISPIVNIIGFDVDSEGETQLKSIAEATEGIYQRVVDESELSKELQKINDIADAWEDWKESNESKIEYKNTQNNIDIFVYISRESYNATFQGMHISNILYAFSGTNTISDEAYEYLDKKNRDYHEWIHSEIDGFKEMLDELKDKNYAEAKKELDAYYEQNKQ